MGNMDIWTLNGIDFTSIKEFAKAVGVSRETIYVWTAKGMPAIRSTSGRILVPIELALKWVEKYRS